MSTVGAGCVEALSGKVGRSLQPEMCAVQEGAVGYTGLRVSWAVGSVTRGIIAALRAGVGELSQVRGEPGERVSTGWGSGGGEVRRCIFLSKCAYFLQVMVRRRRLCRRICTFGSKLDPYVAASCAERRIVAERGAFDVR